MTPSAFRHVRRLPEPSRPSRSFSSTNCPADCGPMLYAPDRRTARHDRLRPLEHERRVDRADARLGNRRRVDQKFTDRARAAAWLQKRLTGRHPMTLLVATMLGVLSISTLTLSVSRSTRLRDVAGACIGGVLPALAAAIMAYALVHEAFF
jgi:hypothetical protein